MSSESPYPRMSFPFSPAQIFNYTAEMYGAEHPQRPPAPRLESEHDELRQQSEAYRTGWIDVVWPDFRRWWTTAPEDERRRKAEEALKPKGLELAGFQAIPDAVWDQTCKLWPVEGDTPFIKG